MKTLSIFFCLFVSLSCYAQSITNVVAAVEDKSIRITYDLTSDESDAVYNISVSRSTDGGVSYFDSLSTYTGDLSGISSGTGKEIVWSPLIDFQEGFTADRLKFKLQGTVAIELISVAGSTFEMGCKSGRDDVNALSCNSDESPLHTVNLSSFKISRYEITNAQYVVFLNAISAGANGRYIDAEFGSVEYIDMDGNVMITHNGSAFEVRSNSIDFSDYPVIEVSWYGANAYAKWAGGRLPTEAEWEFAARGGNSSQGYQFSGSNTLDTVAWHSSNSNSTGQSGWRNIRTHPVGTKAANELGIYDMSGNVWEWCQDWYGSYSSGAQTNPTGANSGSLRSFRGGDWNNSANYARVAGRINNYPTYTHNNLGFRVVLP